MDMISPEPSAARLQITEIDLCGCIGHAAPGLVVEYHRGFLASSRRSRSERRVTWGLVHLVQRRLGPGAFAYLAVVRPKPRHAAISLSSLLQEEPA